MDLQPQTIRVKLSPTPGYCVKSTALQNAVCKVSSKPIIEPESLNPIIIGGPAASGTLNISKGAKVFVNIAWDSNVPPPPEGNEEMIQRAMRGEEEIDDESLIEGGGWFVPVIVSEPREVLDKGLFPLNPTFGLCLCLFSSRDLLYRCYTAPSPLPIVSGV